MNDNLTSCLFEQGLYSDIQLTINKKLYRLHKLLIGKSLFFKTLIDNIGIMSINEEIEIKELSGKLVCSKYIDDVLRWIYTNKNLIIIDLINEKSNFEVVLQYYYVIDFLQIGNTKKEIINIINDRLILCNPSKHNFISISKVPNSIYTYYCNSKKYNVSDGTSNDILGFIYDNLIKISDFFDILKNKRPGRNICNNGIYDQYMSHLYKKNKKDFINVTLTHYSDYTEKNNDVVNCMYVTHQFIIHECLPLLNYIPPSCCKLTLVQVSMLLDIVDDNNKAKLIELLSMDDWYIEGNTIWENINEASNLCMTHNLKKEFDNKLKAFVYVFL